MRVLLILVNSAEIESAISIRRVGWMGKEMGGSFKREGIYVYLWLIHVEV